MSLALGLMLGDSFFRRTVKNWTCAGIACDPNREKEITEYRRGLRTFLAYKYDELEASKVSGSLSNDPLL